MQHILKLKKSLWDYVKDYIILTIGTIIYTGAWAIFILPNNLVGGGASGLSAILHYGTGLSVGYGFFIINGILIIIAVIVLGSGVGVKTIYAIILASVFLDLLQAIVPYEFVEAIAINNGKLMSSIMGAIMAGTGIGMSISVGGSTGGTDIVALIVNKYKNISPGKVILISDAIIILTSLVVPSYTKSGELVQFTDKITTAVYGIIIVAINGHCIDLYLSGTKQSIQVFILSKKYEIMADTITQVLHRGVTVFPAKGWFTKQENQVLMVITKKTDMNILLKYIKTIDPDAFISISYVNGVYGRGFDMIKASAFKKTDNILTFDDKIIEISSMINGNTDEKIS